MPEEKKVCKLCNSWDESIPCAYPTEINRKQAIRIEQLRKALFGVRNVMDATRDHVLNPEAHQRLRAAINTANIALNGGAVGGGNGE